MEETLDVLRDKINSLDAQLLLLFNQRAAIVQQIGKLKQQHCLSVQVCGREETLIARLVGINSGPLSDQMVRQLFQQMIDTLKPLQQPLSLS